MTTVDMPPLDVLHATTCGEHTVLWRIVDGGRRIAIESLTDHPGAVPAYRMRMDGTTVDIPNGTPGIAYFGEGEDRPDLAQVREWFPRQFELWDAVKAQYWDAVSPLDHRRVDDLPYAVACSDCGE
jgi:hypothetical protein